MTEEEEKHVYLMPLTDTQYLTLIEMIILWQDKLENFENKMMLRELAQTIIMCKRVFHSE